MISDRLVLASGVEVTPIHELPAAARRLAHDDARFALTRTGARGTTKLLDAETAALLERFHLPTLFVDAVLDLSARQGLDPHRLLDEMFPVCQRLIIDGVLQLESDRPPTLIPCVAGDTIGPFTVLEQIQALADGAVYRAQALDGAMVCVKHALASDGSAVRQLEREAHMLNRVSGPRFPRLILDASGEPDAFVALEWIPGRSAAAWAERVRQPWGSGAQDRLLDGVLTVVEAYAELHRQAVVHGDVHPRNVLMADDGARIVDFALSRPFGDVSEEPARGGAFPYYEPEWARAMLERRTPPNATPLSDQYAVGALLYALLSGHHHLAMAGDRHTMLERTVGDAPVRFERHGIPAWPEIEAVLARALSTSPDDRFGSMDELSATLREAANHSRVAHPRRLTPERLLAGIETRLGRPGGLIDTGLTAPPYASVNYGAAGVACFWYRLGSLRAEPGHLSRGAMWIDHARRAPGDADAFGSQDIGIVPATVGTASLFHSLAGVHCVSALIANAAGDLQVAADAATAYAARCRTPGEKLDLVSGRAGLLLGTALLVAAFAETNLARVTGLREQGNELVDDIWAELTTASFESLQIRSWGIAHGWAGILYATALWSEATRTGLPPAARQKLDELCARVRRSDQMAWWEGPNDLNLSSSWCHGTAGYTHLLAVANRVTGDSLYAELAVATAEHCWATPCHDGHLCCGTAGQAYAMLAAYAITEDRQWLSRARRLTENSLAWLGTRRSHTNSLYKGDLGVALLVEDLGHPTAAAMPLFGSENWPSPADLAGKAGG